MRYLFRLFYADMTSYQMEWEGKKREGSTMDNLYQEHKELTVQLSFFLDNNTHFD